jgi:hypothetical protein
MTDALNPMLQAIRFWQILELVVALFGIRPRVEREVA